MVRGRVRTTSAGWSALVALALVGCGGGTPAGSADIVAEAGSAILTPEQAAVWAARAPEAPRAGDASYVGLVWVDYTLLTQALEQNVSLTDSATAAQALHRSDPGQASRLA